MMMLLSFLILFFVSSIQPMLMIGSLIMVVLIYSFMLYTILGGYWFSYMLVMVMLSGVLVVFTYLISLIPNESFESYNLSYLLILMLMMFVGFKYMYMLDISIISLELWFSYIGLFNLFLVSFLLSMMIMVMWLSMKEGGPLRIYYGAWLKG